jgi:hypothetical protein
MGKGEKIRTVLINQSLWQQLTSLPRKEGTDAVFVTIVISNKNETI